MNEKTGGILVTPPKGFRLKDVRLDIGKILVGLAKIAEGIGKGSLGDYASTPKIVEGLVGVREAFSRDESLEVRAWRLVHRALAAAMGELVVEYLKGRPPCPWEQKNLSVAIDEAVGEEAVA